MHAADPLQPGSVLAGRYRLGPLLGSGGMAFVHRATDQVLGREVALKALIRTTTDETELQRIQSEIDLLATLSHRSLVTLFDAGSTTIHGTTVTYLVMELVDGPALDARLALGPLAEPDVSRMAQDLAEALVVVHAQGVVHRDLKPANILLAPSPLPGREFDAKLADFGIAALVDAARLTATGTVLGTAAYLSPEQATGARVGPPSDVYSLGLVLLETLTGRREFPGPLLESLGARLTRDPEVPGALGYEWKSLLTAMTARDPEARPTAADVLARLEEQAGGTPLLVGAGAGATAAIAPVALASAAAATAVLPAASEPHLASAADTAPSPVDGPASASVAARPTDAAPRRRRWALVGGIAAGVAVLGTVAAFSMQGAPEAPTAAPKVVQTSEPAAEPAPAPVETTAPAPQPVVEEPVVQEPVVEEPVDEEPVVEQPVAEEPVDEEPVDEEPVDEEPVDEEPVDEEPGEDEGSGNEGNGNGGQGNGGGNGGNGGGGNGGNGGGNGGGGGNGNGP